MLDLLNNKLNFTWISTKNSSSFSSYNLFFNHRVTGSMPFGAMSRHKTELCPSIKLYFYRSNMYRSTARMHHHLIFTHVKLHISRSRRRGGGVVTIIYVIHVVGAIRWQHIPQIPAIVGVMITWDCFSSANMLIYTCYKMNHVKDVSCDSGVEIHVLQLRKNKLILRRVNTWICISRHASWELLKYKIVVMIYKLFLSK